MAGFIGPGIQFLTGIGSLLRGSSAQEKNLQRLGQNDLDASTFFNNLVMGDLLNEVIGLRDSIGQNQQVFNPGGTFEGGFSFGRDAGIVNPATGKPLANVAGQFAEGGARPNLDAQFMVQALPQIAQLLADNPARGATAAAAGAEQKREGAVGDALGGGLQNLISNHFLNKLLSNGPSTGASSGTAPRTPQGFNFNFLPGVGF